MASPEFEATGQTENQRLFRESATSPPKPTGTNRADSFVKKMLADNPGIVDLARGAIGGAPPPQVVTAEFDDLTGPELLEMFETLKSNPPALATPEAAALQAAVEQLSG